MEYSFHDYSTAKPAFKLELAGLAAQKPFQKVKTLLTVEGTENLQKKIEDKTFPVSMSFEITKDMPKWSWQTDPKVPVDQSHQKALLKEVESLRQKLAAVREKSMQKADPNSPDSHGQVDKKFRAEWIRSLPDADNEQLMRALVFPEGSFRELDENLVFETMAEGRIARFHSFLDRPVFDFRGGTNDAPSGTRGPFEVLFDPWYRYEKGKWVLVAFWESNGGLKE